MASAHVMSVRCTMVRRSVKPGYRHICFTMLSLHVSSKALYLMASWYSSSVMMSFARRKGRIVVPGTR
ncbi:hypothetical protein ES708_32472 [subsurface metagenome]